MYGHLEIVFYLITIGADINAKDKEGHTPIMWAVYENHIPVVQLLLEHFPDIITGDSKGMTALHWAASRNKGDCADLLLQHGANINAVNNEGRTPVEEAVVKGAAVLGNYLTLVKSNPKVGQMGKLESYKYIWGFIPFFIALFLIEIMAITPYFVVAAGINFGAGVLFWRYFGAVRWKSIVLSRNPVCVGIILGMFAVSALFWFFHMHDLTTITQLEPLAFTINGVIWVCSFVHLLNRDPGVIRKNTATPEEIVASYDQPPSEGNQYCVSCKCKKPLRSKHCKTSGNCVARFDHYCPWIANAVGIGNHRLFIWVVVHVTLSHAWFVTFCYRHLESVTAIPDDLNLITSIPFYYSVDPIVYQLFLCHVFFGCMNLSLAYNQITGILHNSTVNENRNSRYKWIRVVDGQRVHAYDKGPIGNITEFFKPTIDWFNEFDVPETFTRHNQHGEV